MEYVSRFFDAITWTTALSAAAAVLGFVLIWRESDKHRFEWKMGFAIAALGLLGVATSIADEWSNQAAERKLRNEVSAALQEAEDANAAAASANEAAASAIATARLQPYGFDRNKLVRALRVLGPRAIDVHKSKVFGERNTAQRELDSLVVVIEEAFREAGWSVSSSFPWPDEIENSWVLFDEIQGQDAPSWVEDELIGVLNNCGIKTATKVGDWFALDEAIELLESGEEWPDNGRSPNDFLDWLRSQGIRLHLVVGLPTATEE
jgi:hypothetical protein